MPQWPIRSDFAGVVRCVFAISTSLFVRLVCSGSGPKRGGRRPHRSGDCSACGVAMLRLQPRSIPCSRGMGRKRNNGRNPSPGIYAREYLAFNRPDNVGEALAAAQTASAARGEGDHPRRRRIAAPTRRQTVANAISFRRAQIGLPRGAIILPPRGSLSAAFARSIAVPATLLSGRRVEVYQ